MVRVHRLMRNMILSPFVGKRDADYSCGSRPFLIFLAAMTVFQRVSVDGGLPYLLAGSGYSVSTTQSVQAIAF